ncbi:fasciclin domain-containing protein [Streptomyces sp. NP160]|uniref:fasciclin domain-containing protein n=1 Tax=Streptomyces sp. NP160 TaxID=2586637 RepID=UPI00111BA5DA|nr:fasciclin domain-containing protein [Streptomyces sp. NP160]TNM66966.1 fasciclin domain-containing protein [Streptomyces sp. NP160]
MKRSLTTAFSVSASAFLVLGLAACGGGSTDAGAAASDAASSAMPSESSSMSPSDSMTSDAAMASGPVGPGCADYAAAVPSGAGSVEGMATAPVATAASNNPLLKTLVSAVSGQLNPNVNLVDTLNGSQFTVFAPVDDAFAKVDPATVETLKTDSALLQKVLTYHVVPGQLTPEQVVGMQTTVEGQQVDVTGTPDDLKVNGAQVICGGVKTANATVYLIDGVLMPPS